MTNVGAGVGVGFGRTESDVVKVSSPFEALLAGMEGNREVALNVRHKLNSLKDRIKGPEVCANGSDAQPKDECHSGMLPNLLFVKDDENKILREIEDICTELLELF